MDYQGLGKRVRQYRTERGWTQEALAEHINTSVSFVGHIERGTRKASMETVIKIANALSIDANSLLIDSLVLQHDALSMALSSHQRTVLREVIRVITDNADEWSK